ncbi:hypothetical protein EP331_05030 [bacterium]|nr:MAG: hypothetical protein EP331_05030 [bacterium]
MPNLANRRLFIALFFSISLISCDIANQQDKFEQEAFKTPSGITQTTSDGVISSSDADDWRIAPLFGNAIEVMRPAYPNPTVNQTVRVEFLVSGIDAVQGMVGYVLRQDRTLSHIYQNSNTTLPVGSIVVQIDPSLFAVSGNLSGAIGVHRLIFYDLNDRIITYGDVQVQQ